MAHKLWGQIVYRSLDPSETSIWCSVRTGNIFLEILFTIYFILFKEKLCKVHLLSKCKRVLKRFY